MATISKTWTNSWILSSDLGSTIPSSTSNLSTAVQERMQNLGLYWPATSDTTCGLLYASPNAFNAGYFDIFDVTGGIPDTTKKLFSVSASAIALNKPTSITGTTTITGDLSVSGTITGSTGKNFLMPFTGSGDITRVGSGSTTVTDNALVSERAFFPEGLSGRTVTRVTVWRTGFSALSGTPTGATWTIYTKDIYGTGTQRSLCTLSVTNSVGYATTTTITNASLPTTGTQIYAVLTSGTALASTDGSVTCGFTLTVE